MTPEIFRKSGAYNFGQLQEADAPKETQRRWRSSRRSSIATDEEGDDSSSSEVEIEIPDGTRQPDGKTGKDSFLLRGASGISLSSRGSSGSALLEVPFILTERAKLAVAISVLLNAAAMSVEVEAELQFGRSSVLGLAMYGVQCFFLIVFIVELILNIRCHGLSFFYRRGGPAMSANCIEALHELGYKIHFQGIFDFFVVLAALVDLCIMRPINLVGGADGSTASDAFSAFRVLQLFRLARIFQLLRLSHELSSLAFNLAMSLRAVFWVFLLLFTLIYIGALFCASELGTSQNDEMRRIFGNIWVSIFSHFKLMTLEQWVDICNAAMEVNPLWAVYFLCFIILTNLTLVNLVTGLIITGVVEHAREDNWTWQERLVEETPFVKATEEMVKKMGIEEDHLTFESFEMLLSDLQFQAILSLYGISMQLEPSKLFDILSTEASGHLDIQHFARSLLQLRGSRSSLHPIMVRHDINVNNGIFRKQVRDLMESVPQAYMAQVKDCEQSIAEQLSNFDTDLRQQLRHRKGPKETEGGACQEKILSEKLLPILHSAAESVEVLRSKISRAAAELRDLEIEEHRLTAQLHRHEGRQSRGTQTCNRTPHRS